MIVSPYPYSTWHTYLGTLAQERRINITSNNLANANTPGFKRDVPVFEGYMVKQSRTDFRQGALKQTNNDFDMALSGPGFFQVETPQGVRYTRDGSFTRNQNGDLVTQEGYRVVATQPINIPPNTVDLHLTENGTLMANGQILGQLEIVEFEDPKVLAKEGHNRYMLKTEGVEPQDAENTTVHQGYLEMSNTDPVMESVNLIDTLRTYEVFQKIVHSFQEADTKTINEVGRLT